MLFDAFHAAGSTIRGSNFFAAMATIRRAVAASSFLCRVRYSSSLQLISVAEGIRPDAAVGAAVSASDVDGEPARFRGSADGDAMRFGIG